MWRRWNRNQIAWFQRNDFFKSSIRAIAAFDALHPATEEDEDADTLREAIDELRALVRSVDINDPDAAFNARGSLEMNLRGVESERWQSWIEKGRG